MDNRGEGALTWSEKEPRYRQPSLDIDTDFIRQRYPGRFLAKRTLDIVIGSMLIVLGLPIFLLIALLIKLFSPGPVIFCQRRCGLHGSPFTMYKFRTMAVDAAERRRELAPFDEADGPVFKIRRDPRLIPVLGTILRRTGLDEAPQLFNVLMGEMSLVGPRPPLPEEVERYEEWHKKRLWVKPGITCLWQIQPHRNNFRFDQWMALDIRYIENWSLTLDLEIMIRTIPAIVLGYGC